MGFQISVYRAVRVANSSPTCVLIDGLLGGQLDKNCGRYFKFQFIALFRIGATGFPLPCHCETLQGRGNLLVQHFDSVRTNDH